MALDKRISLQKLEVFCLVVELGGVGAAAERLEIAQPVVSAHLRTVQERLGAQLLYRDGRRLRLTEAGEAAYRWAKEVLSRSQEVVREIEGLVEGGPGGAVVAASMTMGSYVLPAILAAFRRRHPEAPVALHVGDAEHVRRETEMGIADFAVIATDDPLEPPGIEIERIGDEELVLVAGPDDPQVGARTTLEEASRLAYVCSPGGPVHRRPVEAALRRVGIDERNVVMELGHAEALKRAVRASLGVAFLFRSSVARELELGALRRVEVEGVRLTIPVLLIRRAGKRLSPLQLELVEAIRGAVAARGGAGDPSPGASISRPAAAPPVGRAPA